MSKTKWKDFAFLHRISYISFAAQVGWQSLTGPGIAISQGLLFNRSNLPEISTGHEIDNPVNQDAVIAGHACSPYHNNALAPVQMPRADVGHIEPTLGIVEHHASADLGIREHFYSPDPRPWG